MIKTFSGLLNFFESTIAVFPIVVLTVLIAMYVAHIERGNKRQQRRELVRVRNNNNKENRDGR